MTTTIGVTRFAVRHLHDFDESEAKDRAFDVIAYCNDGQMRHSPDVYDTRDEAEVYIAGWELNPVPAEELLDGWITTTVSEGETT